MVADVHCRYHHPARYDELLTVRTRILEAKTRTLKFGYELFRQEDQKLLATGHTIHVACSRAGQVKHFPDKYKAAFLSMTQSIANPCKGGFTPPLFSLPSSLLRALCASSPPPLR